MVRNEVLCHIHIIEKGVKSKMKNRMKTAFVVAMGLVACCAGAGECSVLDIGSRRELFCDGAIVNAQLTTATRMLHHPEFASTAFVLDRPWEGSGCSYGTILRVGDGYVLYYVAHPFDMRTKKSDKVRICYAESKDGLAWIRPNLGRSEFGGSKDNNILLGAEFCTVMDNFNVFVDANPDCPPAERFKMILEYSPTNGEADKGLWLMTSPNPIEFRLSHEIVRRDPWEKAKENGGVLIDTQSTAFWDSERKLYHLYTRGYHRRYDDRNGDTHIRDIRHATSKDFRTWSKLEFLDFGSDAEDYPLYTNVIAPYERAPHIYVGFPTRYVERQKWMPSYDCLPQPEVRREKMKAEPRFGLAITDTVFMSSRDGHRFERINEAFLPPGPESVRNWIYGDGYVYYGRLIVPGRAGRDLELAFLHWDRDFESARTLIQRYNLRMDGFVSYFGTYAPQHLVTRKLRFSGERLFLNFATSARGFIRLRIVEDLTGRTAESVEIFGDATDREIAFEKGKLADFSGKPVTLDFELCDAHVYSFKFQ